MRHTIPDRDSDIMTDNVITVRARPVKETPFAAGVES